MRHDLISLSTRSSRSNYSYGTDVGPDIDELDDEELGKYIKELETKLKFLKLENIYFLKHLEKIEPNTIQVTRQCVENLYVKHTQRTDNTSRISDASIMSITLAGSPSIMRSHKKVLGTFLKTELLLSVMSDAQKDYNSFKRGSTKILENYKAESEESRITCNELTGSYDVFENAVVLLGFDRLTQRIPAEKFLRFMDEWLRIAQAVVQKLLLYNNNEKILLKKLTTLYSQKEQLSENIHAVDFDQLNIENKNLKKKTEDRTKHVKELKKINGWANLILSTYKQFLQVQSKDAVILRQLVTEARTRLSSIRKEIKIIEQEIVVAKDDYSSFKQIADTFYVPDVMEYVSTKSKLYEKYDKLKIAQRRMKILDIALNACTTQMKNLKGTHKIDPEWYMEEKKSTSYLSLSI